MTSPLRRAESALDEVPRPLRPLVWAVAAVITPVWLVVDLVRRAARPLSRVLRSLARLVTAPRVVGALFFGVAMAMEATILVQHFGKGMVFQSNGGPPHVASGWVVLGLSAFLAIFWGVGLALMVFGGPKMRGPG